MVLSRLRICLLTAIGLKVVAAKPAEKTTQPHECSNDNLPYQSIMTDAAFELLSWDWASGERSVHWSLPRADFPEIQHLNACGINPKDNIAYCVIVFSKGAASAYVARVDKDGFAIVARTPDGKSSVSGSFDEVGIFWVNVGGVIWKLEGAHELKGWTEPPEDLPEVSVVGESSMEHGSDNIVWQGHLVSIASGQVVVTKLSDPGLETWAAKPNPPDLLRDHFGGGYMYSGSIFFSANDGSGVFKIQLDLQSRSIVATRVGASIVSSYNDGLNCIFTESPSEVGDVGGGSPSKDASLGPSTFSAWIFVLAFLGDLLMRDAALGLV